MHFAPSREERRNTLDAEQGGGCAGAWGRGGTSTTRRAAQSASERSSTSPSHAAWDAATKSGERAGALVHASRSVTRRAERKRAERASKSCSQLSSSTSCSMALKSSLLPRFDERCQQISPSITNRGCHRARPARVRGVGFQGRNGDGLVCLGVGIKERPARGAWGEGASEVQNGGQRRAYRPRGFAVCGADLSGWRRQCSKLQSWHSSHLSTDGWKRAIRGMLGQVVAPRRKVCADSLFLAAGGALRELFRGDFSRAGWGAQLSSGRRTVCAGGGSGGRGLALRKRSEQIWSREIPLESHRPRIL